MDSTKISFLRFLFLFIATLRAEAAPDIAKIQIDLDRPVSGYGLEDAFGPLRFDQPVRIVSPPGETNRLFVVERKGLITVITNLSVPNRTVFMDLRKDLYSGYEECGLLGMAFHPGFQTNGHFFVYRTPYLAGVIRNQISRFTISDLDPNKGDPSSEFALLSQKDLHEYHNGGDLHFGPDGYLYFAIGDGSPAMKYKSEKPMAVDKGFFGGVFRIDVDHRPGNLQPNPHDDVIPGAYSIPIDNPWVGATSHLGRPIEPDAVRTEFFAIGLRNPYRFSVDLETGDVFCGDVGERKMEEINLVTRGKDYGWPYLEGTSPRYSSPPGPTVSPLFEYPHDRIHKTNTGSAVIGGFVVRQGRVPDLEGAYIFGDFGSGNIWALDRHPEVEVRWLARESGLSAFGRDPRNGDVLLANFNEGTLRRLVYVAPSESGVPQRLSELGAFDDLSTLKPAPGIEPFEINVPFYSDNALKKRWFGLTKPQTKFGFLEDGNWQLPPGSVWFKHFDLEMKKGDPASARRIETRVLIMGNEKVFGYTYRWGDSISDAELVPASGLDEAFVIDDQGTLRTQIWHYPGRGECHSCHPKIGGFALGFRTEQLNIETFHGGDLQNQLERMARAGYLDPARVEASSLRRLAKPDDYSQPLQHRVRSFLASNCSQCHRPGGPIGVQWDALITTPISQANIIDGTVTVGDPADRIVSWRQPETSLLLKVLTFDPTFFHHMPPFATTQVNEEARALLTEWINTLPDRSWKSHHIGGRSVEGSAAERDETLTISGAGAGPHDPGQTYFFMYQSFTNNFHIVGQIDPASMTDINTTAGILLRSDTGNNSAFAGLIKNGSGHNSLVSRAGESFPITELVGSQVPSAEWLRLIREGQSITAWESFDGESWRFVGARTIDSANNILVGIAIASGHPWKYASADIEHLQMLSISLIPPVLDPEFRLPRPITLKASVFAQGCVPRNVDFYSGDRRIGSGSGTAWAFEWTNALAGDHELVAVVTEQSGLSVTSAPVRLLLQSVPVAGRYLSSPGVDPESWQETIGAGGFAIPLLQTNLPIGGVVHISAADTKLYSQGPGSAGLDDLSSGQIASAWTADNPIILQYSPPSEHPYRITLFTAAYSSVQRQDQISLFATATGALLDEREVFLDPGQSRFLSWIIRGAVKLELRSLSSQKPELNGVFIDPVGQPTVTLTSPAQGAVFGLPDANVRIEAEVESIELGIDRVEVYDGTNRIAAFDEKPYETIWKGSYGGERTLTAQLMDEFGAIYSSDPVSVRFELPPAAATFVGMDTETQGEWIRNFGADGYLIPGLPSQIPPGASITLTPSHRQGIWETRTQDPRGVARLDSDWGIASNWYYYGDLITPIDLLDGNYWQLSAYFLNWDRFPWAQTVQIVDASNGTVLDERRLEDMGDGVFLVWNVRGKIRLKLTDSTHPATALSSFFLGGPVSPAKLWRIDLFGGEILDHFDWNLDPDNDGRPHMLEYAIGSHPLNPDPNLFDILRNGDDIFLEVSQFDPPGDARVILERSNDLREWSSSPAESTEINGKIRYRLQGSAAYRFYRLRAEILFE